MVEHGEIRVVHRGGSKLNFRVPVISSDSRFLLVASGQCVKVFSTSTEECVHDLRGHTDLVTGVLLRPSNHLQVYSCSLDGSVRLWDFTDAIPIKTFVVGQPVHAVLASPQHEGVIFVIVPSRSECFQLVAVQLPQTGDQQVEAREFSAVLDSVSSSPAAVAFGRGGEFVASARGLQLDVYFFRKQKSYRFSLKENNKKGGKNTFTCLTCHPTDDCLATGHEDGKIRLWRKFDHQKNYTYSTLHWHHSAVTSLCFTPGGSSLLSGGVESVLVQWRYDQENQKDFLPRLGAAITHVTASPDGTLFCTSHSDNKITIIQSCVKVSAVIQGLVRGDAVRTGLLVDPRSRALVLNGKPGHLQFYSLQRDKLLYNLDVVQQEFIHEAGLRQFEVVEAALHPSGVWLATVEERRQKDVELEVNLKLWMFQEETQSLVLNTTISAPHEAGITSLCFQPAAASPTAVLVSASSDGHFKAWRLADDEGPSWSCDFVGAYHSLPPASCCFSADGSLLAVGFQEVVTVWSSASWELVTTLSQPPGAIRDLCFGRLSCSKYLLGTTAGPLLCCWNLLTCSLEWSTPMDVSLLLADPLSDNMAAFCWQSGAADLFVFKPSEPRPLFSLKAVSSGKVSRAVFAPRDQMLDSCQEGSQWLNRSQLYFLSQHMDLMTFSTRAEDDRMMDASRQLVVDDSVAMTPFYLLLGKRPPQHQDRRDAETETTTPTPRSSAAVKELLRSPAHVLPAASFLASVFVQSLLVSAAEPREEDEPAEEEMESEKEEEDSEGEMESSISRAAAAAGEEEAGGALTPPTPPVPSRAEAKELRRLRKSDHSWLTGLLDS